MKDLLIINGKISDNYIFQKLHSKVNFLSEKYRLQLALRKFKELMESNIPNEIIYSLPVEPMFPGKENLVISEQPSKLYYHHLVPNKSTLPNLTMWSMKLMSPLPETHIIVTKKILDIKENKLAEFNFKFINNIMACGKMLSKRKPFISDKCVLCNEDETQCHIIYECQIVNRLWQVISNVIGKRISLDDIAFGIDLKRETNNLISQICYTIHKYWIIRVNEQNMISGRHLIELVNSDLRFKYNVMRYLKEDGIAQQYKRALDNLVSGDRRIAHT